MKQKHITRRAFALSSIALTALALSSFAAVSVAEQARPKPVKTVETAKKTVEPTFRDVAYGPHEINKLDFWKAESKTPTPLVFYIHGGGWGGGSKGMRDEGPYTNLLKNGVSFVSINYRLARGENKLPCSLHDAARALA